MNRPLQVTPPFFWLPKLFTTFPSTGKFNFPFFLLKYFLSNDASCKFFLSFFRERFLLLMILFTRRDRRFSSPLSLRISLRPFATSLDIPASSFLYLISSCSRIFFCPACFVWIEIISVVFFI